MNWSIPLLHLAISLLGAQSTFALAGKFNVHDPSTVAKCDGKYYVFGTGRGINILSSPNGFDWQPSGQVFDRIPDSVKAYVPKNDGVDVWAPDVIQLNGQYYLYYSVSSWGDRPSAIGLVTNPTLDPQAPNYHWTDRGMVVHSVESQFVNAIDPSVLLAPDGRLWLGYGSYMGNIELIELNPKTGLRVAPDSAVTIIASRSEAVALIQRDGTYYLFVNHGSCCKGINSTYHIRVGRSKAVTGPYLDRHGDDLVLGAGSLFLASADNQIGPGHFGWFVENGVEKFSIHYEGELGRFSRPFLAIRPLLWSDDGWPLAGDNLKAGTYQIRSQRKGEVLQSRPETPDIRLETAPYVCRPHQQWTVTPTDAGCFRIINAGTALQAMPDATLSLAKTAETDPQLWQIDALTDGSYRIATKDRSRVLATASGNRNGLTLEPFTGSAAQRWAIAPP